MIVPRIEALMDLKASPGKDVWLFGGGKLFRNLAEAGMVENGGGFRHANSVG